MSALKTTFAVRGRSYELTLARRARAEADKFQPFDATVTGQPKGPVQGTLSITDEALKAADERASGGNGSADELLARACGRSLASEVLIRELKPAFTFVVDHRWL